MAESDETNNLLTVPITITGMPDLTPTSLTAPARSDSGLPVTLTWSVKNQGLAEARPSWQDRVYLSQ